MYAVYRPPPLIRCRRRAQRYYCSAKIIISVRRPTGETNK